MTTQQTTATGPSATGPSASAAGPQMDPPVTPKKPTCPPGIDPADARPNPAAAAFKRLAADFGELKEYGSFYLAAKMDSWKATVKKLGLLAALGVIGLIVGAGILATAGGILVVGIAQGLGKLFGGQIWLGYIVTSLLILGAIGVTAWLMMKKLTGSWRTQTIERYEQRKQDQQQQFGRNVAQRASESGRPG